MIWHTHPFISCLLLVTDATRIGMALRAVECFNQQTWPLKELVVVNTTGRGLGIKSLDILPKSASVLRNMAEECAKGEWCVLWRDDCWFDPGYISAVMAEAGKDHVVTASPISVYRVSDKRQHPVHTDELKVWFRLKQLKVMELRAVEAHELVLKFVR